VVGIEPVKPGATEARPKGEIGDVWSAGDAGVDLGLVRLGQVRSVRIEDVERAHGASVAWPQAGFGLARTRRL
jgi:hypothetical protein